MCQARSAALLTSSSVGQFLVRSVPLSQRLSVAEEVGVVEVVLAPQVVVVLEALEEVGLDLVEVMGVLDHQEDMEEVDHHQEEVMVQRDGSDGQLIHQEGAEEVMAIVVKVEVAADMVVGVVDLEAMVEALEGVVEDLEGVVEDLGELAVDLGGEAQEEGVDLSHVSSVEQCKSSSAAQFPDSSAEL